MKSSTVILRDEIARGINNVFGTVFINNSVYYATNGKYHKTLNIVIYEDNDPIISIGLEAIIIFIGDTIKVVERFRPVCYSPQEHEMVEGIVWEIIERSHGARGRSVEFSIVDPSFDPLLSIPALLKEWISGKEGR